MNRQKKTKIVYTWPLLRSVLRHIAFCRGCDKWLDSWDEDWVFQYELVLCILVASMGAATNCSTWCNIMKWCNVFVDHANLEISHMFKSASNPVRRILASHDWSTGENRLRAVQNLMPPPCLVLRILPSRFVYMQWTTNDKNPYELDVQITLNCHMSHVYKGEHKLVYYRGLKSRLPVWLLTSHLLHVPGAKEWQVIKSDLNSSVDLFSMALHKQYWLVMLLFQSTRKIWSTYINSNVK